MLCSFIITIISLLMLICNKIFKIEAPKSYTIICIVMSISGVIIGIVIYLYECIQKIYFK